MESPIEIKYIRLRYNARYIPIINEKILANRAAILCCGSSKG